MNKSLNLYATKAFAEHPISLWPLDESVGYISWINPSLQNLSNWEKSGASVVDAKDVEQFEQPPPIEPFKGIYVNGLIEELGNDGEMIFTFPDDVPDSLINENMGSFSISLFACTYERNNVEVSIGFSYVDSESLEEKMFIKTIKVPPTRDWAFISETFALPNNYSEIKPIIEIKYPINELIYEIAIHGISIGQWSEEFQTTSLGISPEPLPENIPLISMGVEALAYGLQGNPGYYLSSNNTLYAKNYGVPLVFGSSNSTVIYQNPTEEPSLILPGEGFMNQAGQYKPLTFEFWANIQSNAKTPKRIFGPIASSDGIYVDKHLIKLKIGNMIGSHNIGEWGRPMLLGIRLTFNNSSLLINGEEVINLDLSRENIEYPPDFDNGNSLDWLGFYAHEDVPIIQIECPAIYPYEVPAIVQKRKFVYGQGVDFPPSVRGLDTSTLVSIDYPVSNYAKNISYPQSNRWKDGFLENLDVSRSAISLPSYPLPEVVLSEGSENEWRNDNYDLSNSEFSILPGEGWSERNGYLYFKRLNFLKEKLSAFYALIRPSQISSENIETIFRFENTSEQKYMNIYLHNGYVFYSLEYTDADGESQEEIFYSSEQISSEDPFVVGLDIAKASTNFGSRVASFLGTLQNIKLYIGGRQTFDHTFQGNIINVSFLGKRNLQKTKNIFSEKGIPLDHSGVVPSEESNKASHVATYSLVPSRVLDTFSLDIAVDSYWEDYVPLSYFGRYAKDYQNNDFFALDFIQFNIDYIKINQYDGEFYDTSGLPVKTYVSFQYLKDGANANPNYFTATQPMPKSGIINPGADWLKTRYEILNDSIIKMPLGANINNLALVISIEFLSSGILQDNISIRSLDLSSQAFGQSPNRIKTRFGSDIIPFKRSGRYFEYKAVQPFSIYKKQSPYLYLTKDSGIRLRGEYDTSGKNGLSIPINKNKASFFKINLFQMFLKYEGVEFPIAPVQIFEMQAEDQLIKFYLVADSQTRQRGQIYAIDEMAGSLMTGIVYYIDGNVVKRPILNLNSWVVLGMSFDKAIDFSFFTGALRFTNPILFNNVSYYQTTQLDEIQRFAYRKWSAVRSGIAGPLDWQYWKELDSTRPDPNNPGQFLDYTWQEVLFLSESKPTLPDASEIYKQYTGTNSYIFNSEKSLQIKDYSGSYYKDTIWSTSVTTPV
jgi:hypothetical protein